jgi:hypothetical protein
MFLIVLGGALVLGAGLLAAASLSGGTIVTTSTAALTIGWLFILATVVGVAGLRRGDFAQLGAAGVAFLSGLTVLYVAYFAWGDLPSAPIRYAVAETLPAYEVVQPETPAAVVPVATKQVVAEAKPVLAPVATVAAPQPGRDACASLTGVQSLQCRRCGETHGIAWLACQERVRLEYCEARGSDEATCPSAIPYTPAG